MIGRLGPYFRFATLVLRNPFFHISKSLLSLSPPPSACKSGDSAVNRRQARDRTWVRFPVITKRTRSRSLSVLEENQGFSDILERLEEVDLQVGSPHFIQHMLCTPKKS